MYIQLKYSENTLQNTLKLTFCYICSVRVFPTRLPVGRRGQWERRVELAQPL